MHPTSVVRHALLFHIELVHVDHFASDEVDGSSCVLSILAISSLEKKVEEGEQSEKDERTCQLSK
jgi:hypothetical protein